MRSTAIVISVVLAGIASAAGCADRSPIAYGEADSIVVAAPDSLWMQIRDTVQMVLEPRIFTVRNERTFELTQVAPTHPDWATLREWRQVLVIGRADDPWVAPILEGRADSIGPLPALVEHDAIWARGQSVTALVLPAEGMAEAIIEILPQVHEYFDARFRRQALERMFVSGADTALQDTLLRDGGFSLLVPAVYDWLRTGETTYRFLNANPSGGELDRSILVSWIEGTQKPTSDALLAWRDSVAATAYEWEQRNDRERIETTPLGAPTEGSIEVQGVWLGTDAGYPMAGPFLTRAVPCPSQNRTYLLDAWLYAPSKDKYEYVLQLQTILDSFACGT